VDADQAWQSALGQLQMEMPKASFDTWVRDARMVSYEDGLFSIGVRNSYTRDWLESRLSTTVTRLLTGIMNRSAEVKFVVRDSDGGEAEVGDDEDEQEVQEEGEEVEYDPADVLRGHSRYLTTYEEIVKPHRVIVVPGYLTRLIPERGANAIFAYIGFSQVAWMNSRREEDSKTEIAFRAPVASVAKYAGANRTAFYKQMNNETFWKSLDGLISREESGNKYTLFRTLPLSKKDAQDVARWLKLKMDLGESLEKALQDAVELPTGNLVGRLLNDIYAQRAFEADPEIPVYVPDIARYVVGERELDLTEAEAAEALHVRIVYAFKDLAVRHYFMTDVIRRAGLSTDQASLVLASRYRCYANPLTGEVVNNLVVPGGYEELASWIGLSRPKTVWEWLSGYSREVHGHDERGHKQMSNVRKGGIPGFLVDVTVQAGEDQESAKVFCVRLLEPIGFDDQDGDLWRSWDPTEDHRAAILSMRQALPREKAEGKANRDRWSLEDLLRRAGVFPQVQDKLIKAGVDAARFLAWVYFCFSLKNTSKYRVNSYPAKVLSENPLASPGDGFYRLACLPPSMIRLFVDATPASLTEVSQRTGIPDWDELMGNNNQQIGELKRILFGN